MHVLDTDACVDLLREPAAMLPRIEPLEERGPLLTTSITVQELHEGAKRASDPDEELARVERLLSSLEVLPHDERSAARAGSIAARLLDDGRPIGDLDTAIAAITLHHQGTLVTGNVRHFRRVPDLQVHPL